ncbi:MAG: o-succinylbenzoate synthase [Anaerolineae bacterium]|nr:MAG: o-succinylbenzoate synthase [Anaerolineae bacterium]
MKIEAVEIHHISMPLVRRFETSMHVEHERECILIRVEGDGQEGWGECVAQQVPWYSYESVGTAWHVLEDFLVPAILGAELESAVDFPGRVKGIKGHPMAKAGLELALWDLEGRLESMPLVELLGGERMSVEVGVSIGIQEDVSTLLSVIQDHLAEGYRRIKLKIKPGTDLEIVRAVREAHPDLRLQVDANAAYEVKQSHIFEEMDLLTLELIEQPFPAEDILAHAALQARLSTPVCLDESIDSATMARQALDLDACRVINIKPGRVGGLTEALKIHDLCLERDIPVWCGGMLETGIGRASNLALASLPGFTLPGDISATDRYYELDVASPRFELNSDGTIDVPQGAGLGVVVDRTALEGFTIRSKRFTV